MMMMIMMMFTLLCQRGLPIIIEIVVIVIVHYSNEAHPVQTLCGLFNRLVEHLADRDTMTFFEMRKTAEPEHEYEKAAAQ